MQQYYAIAVHEQTYMHAGLDELQHVLVLRVVYHIQAPVVVKVVDTIAETTNNQVSTTVRLHS